MTASWKIFAFAGGALIAGATTAACTITSNSGDGDGGLIFDDDSGAGSDTATTSPCADEIFSDGGTTALTFPATDTAACTTCTQTSCCDAVSACFQDPTGDCQDLETCLEQAIENPDAGVSTEDCASLHTTASMNLHNTWGACQQTNCADPDAGLTSCL